MFYCKCIELEKKWYCGEYLLCDLVVRIFLLGYGFLIDVVMFDNFMMEDYICEKLQKSCDKKDCEDNVFCYKGLFFCNFGVVICEYVLGVEIIFDGCVFCFVGVLLYWYNINVDINEVQCLDCVWCCYKCGIIGYEEGMSSFGMFFCFNSVCGEKIIMDNCCQVLQFVGFVIDVYVLVMNNIEIMKFVLVVFVWVFVKVEFVLLFNLLMGYMVFGVDGYVFQ